MRRGIVIAAVAWVAGCPLGADNGYFAPCASDDDCRGLTCDPARSVCVLRGTDAGPDEEPDAGQTPDAGPEPDPDAGPEPDPDAGPAADAGPIEPVVFTFADDAAFATGTVVDLDLGNGLVLNNSADGFWLSPILTVPSAMTPFSLEVVAGTPWGLSFPGAPLAEPSGGVNPEALALALGFDGPPGPVDETTAFEDRSASPVGVSLVQIGAASGALRAADGPIGEALFLSGDEYLDVDSVVDGDFYFGGGGFTFAAWMRTGRVRRAKTTSSRSAASTRTRGSAPTATTGRGTQSSSSATTRKGCSARCGPRASQTAPGTTSWASSVMEA